MRTRSHSRQSLTHLQCEYWVKMHVDPLIRMVFGFYKDARSVFWMKRKFSAEFGYCTGLRQGSRWSPDLAAFFVEHIILIMQVIDSGISFGGAKIICIFYADDLILFETDPVILQELLDLLCQECLRTGLDINVGKTVHSIFCKKTNTSSRSIILRHTIGSLFCEFHYISWRTYPIH